MQQSEQQQQVDDLGFCPSFSCYTSDSPASTAAVRISRELQQRQLKEHFHDEDDEYGEFEFSLMIGDEEFPANDIDFDDTDGRTVFPLFNRDLLIQNDVEYKAEETACTTSLEKLFITEREEIASSSSESESDESDGESKSPAVLCVWRHKTDAGASPQCKKSRSTGSGSRSGSKRWSIRDLLRRSNSEGKEPMVMLTRKKVEIPKRKVNSGEVTVSAGKLKASSPSVHEVFYVKQRAEREVVKRKSYLPYRQGLVGFFSNGNGKGKGKGKVKKLPF